MRTTLEIEDDLVIAAKQLARERGTTMGEVVSQLMRQGLERKPTQRMRNGVPVFDPVPGARGVDMEFINRLRDEEE